MRSSLVVSAILLSSVLLALITRGASRGLRVARSPSDSPLAVSLDVLALPRVGRSALGRPMGVDSLLDSAAFGPWREAGFVVLTPPISLPGDAAGRFHTAILIALPSDAVIDGGPGGLRWPEGARLDRIEWLEEDGQPRIADVRATELVRVDGNLIERFHALRPSGLGIDAPLAGGSYLRGDEAGRLALGRGFAALAERGGVFLAAERGSRAAFRASSLLRLHETHRCAGCHAHDEAEADPHGERWLRRGTDAMGFYVPRYLMQDDAPMERYRPVDRSAENDFVRVACGGEAVDRERDPSSAMRCPDGSAPRLSLDVSAGMRADDPHTMQVCASRRWLAARLSEAARAPHELAIAECGGPR